MVVQDIRGVGASTSLGMVLFLLGMFCLPAGVGKFVMVPALLLMAATVARAWMPRRAMPQAMERWDMAFLAFSLVWTAVTVVANRPALPPFLVLGSNILLLLLFALAIEAMRRRDALRLFLQIVIVLACTEAAASMLFHLYMHYPLTNRLESLGRASNPIPAAGGYASALIACFVLWWQRRTSQPVWIHAVRIAVVIVIASALLWSGSRGPVMALIAAVGFSGLLRRRDRPALVFTCAMVTWTVIASLVLFEPEIRRVLCASNIGRLCAESLRLEVWSWVFDDIKTHPLVGLGFDFRFAGDRPHAHNGLAALALGGGLPFLMIFLALCLGMSRRIARQPDDAITGFSSQALVFAFGYMATDLPNPLGFINTHYLFLWFPIFLTFARPTRATAAEPNRSHVPEGIRAG